MEDKFAKYKINMEFSREKTFWQTKNDQIFWKPASISGDATFNTSSRISIKTSEGKVTVFPFPKSFNTIIKYSRYLNKNQHLSTIRRRRQHSIFIMLLRLIYHSAIWNPYGLRISHSSMSFLLNSNQKIHFG